MKTLLLMRHAKSGYPPDVADDFDRPLSRRGRRDLPRLAECLAAVEPPVERICASPAVRARETAETMAAALGLAGPALVFDDRLYLADAATLRQVAAERLEGVSCGMVVAHNPGLEDWLARLCGAAARLPTAAVAAVELPMADWADLGEGNGRLLWLLVPRLLHAAED
ncbi:MAG: histidine phosphatase family protein [Candidatus Latescibacterota bacterium]|jgi:phosphohistidine phosphatase